MRQYIVWNHRHGQDTVFVDCPVIANEKTAWSVLKAYGCDVEPDLFDDEYIEDYGAIPAVTAVTAEEIDEAFESIKYQWIERCEATGFTFNGDSRPPSENS